ncbi:MAG: transposase [Mojavia pulchra JT2-VF2]|uniref:Transposase n=1 Tax=Mojavia pulchra JT2-VF2 TaxID=287848 RepID=A0A951PWK1_9NOST|nr:transposase [Mojavia pulchra JT2-VF2]
MLWKKNYNQRAGIEATHSQGIRRSALRRSRYIGLVKTHIGAYSHCYSIEFSQVGCLA